MGTLQHQVLAGVDLLRLALRPVAPQHEHAARVAMADRVDQRVGDPLPAELGVAAGQVRPYRQHAVEQQYTLFGPTAQVAMIGDRQRQVAVEFLVDVAQGRWNAHLAANRERQAHCLAGAVVRVLAQDHHLGFLWCEKRQRAEYRVTWRVDGFVLLTLAQFGIDRVQLGLQIGYIKYIAPQWLNLLERRRE
jgi:hypothetical protein